MADEHDAVQRSHVHAASTTRRCAALLLVQPANMTETASFTTARYGQAASTSTAASLPGKTLPAPPASSITGPSSNLHSHRQSHNSSKLPSFRFADIKNAPSGPSHPLPHAAKQPLPLSPRQLAPPVASIISADSQLDASRTASTRTRSELGSNKILTSSASARNRQAPPATDKIASPPRPSLRPRASYQTAIKPSIVEQHRRVRRPVSYPDSLADEAAQSAKAPGIARASSLRQTTRRLPASRTSADGVTPDGPRSSLSARPPAIEEAVSPTSHSKPAARERGLSQRDLPAAKPSSDENHDQPLHRPPVSYKPPANNNNNNNNATGGQSAASTAVRVPPIRGFRSSGSRKSSMDEMNYHSRSYDVEDRYMDSTDDHTLRALDGDLFDQRSPPTSRHGTNADDTGDVFLKIASEEAARHSEAENNDGRTTSVWKEAPL